MRPSKEIEFWAHFYQPPREGWLYTVARSLQVGPEWNGIIYDQSYKNILEKGIPQEGFAFSLYGPLREWMKRERRDGFKKIKQNINNLPDKEYKVMGDPYLHDIMPLLPDRDQVMNIKIGKEAFKEDLDFYPNSLWLPEAGAGKNTLLNVKKAGYEYVVLGNHQLRDTRSNPMWVNLPEGREIAVFHFDSKLSGDYSYVPSITSNGDEFLDRYCWRDGIHSIASDGEFYGHHQKWKDLFIAYILSKETLKRHGLAALDIKDALTRPRMRTEVVENSSWSCFEDLGRWTGDERCFCDQPTPEARMKKRELFNGLSRRNIEINELLDRDGGGWRDAYQEAFLINRAKIFSGENFVPDFFKSLRCSKGQEILYLAKLYALTGLTSCGWFFGKRDSIERQIPEAYLGEVNNLLHA
jgi:hypothetical protein